MRQISDRYRESTLPPQNRIGAAYIRVSTNDQLELSPESQLQEILKYADENRISVRDEFIFMEKDGRSGKRAGNRPEFQRMIATSKNLPRPFDVILVWKFSRFARNQDESTFYKGMLRKKLGIDIESVSEPVLDGMYGRLIELIIEWQDEFYSYNLSAEVRRGMHQKALGGGYQSGCPYGYRHAGTGLPPAVCAEEAAVVRDIFGWFTDEKMGCSAIAKALNEKGCKTKHGKNFESRTVSYILQNPFYTGKVCWNRLPRRHAATDQEESGSPVISEGRHEALITSELFERASGCFADKKNKPAVRISSPDRHYLSGLLKCPVCGASLSYSSSQYPCFQCWKYVRGLHPESVSLSEKKAVRFLIKSLSETGLTSIIDVLDDPAVPGAGKNTILSSVLEKIVYDRSKNKIFFYYHLQ